MARNMQKRVTNMNTAHTSGSQLKIILTQLCFSEDTSIYYLHVVYFPPETFFLFNSDLRAMKNFASSEKENEV